MEEGEDVREGQKDELLLLPGARKHFAPMGWMGRESNGPKVGKRQ
jgi:hypothetical protein